MNSKFIHVKYLAVLLLGIVILLLVSFDAFSQSEVSIEAEDTMTLNASNSIMREEVSYEPYESTCYRDVEIGSRTVCSPGRSERRCRKVPGVGDECWDEVTEEICRDEPIYSSEAYSCTKHRRVVDYVYDYSVSARINVIKTLRSKNFDLSGCALGVRLAANDENFYARCGGAIVKGQVLDRKEVMAGRNKERAMKIELDFFSIEGLSALKDGLEDLERSQGVISFVATDLAKASNFKLSLKLVRNRFLLKDKVLFDRELKTADYKTENLADGRVKYVLNLSKMTGLDMTKKHTVSVALSTVKSVDIKEALNTPGLTNSLSRSLVIND